MKTEITLLIRDAGSDIVREATGTEILEAARAYLFKRLRRGTTLSSPKATREQLSNPTAMTGFAADLKATMPLISTANDEVVAVAIKRAQVTINFFPIVAPSMT